MEGGEPPGSSSSAVMTTIAAPLAAGVANAPVAPTVAAIPSPGSSTIAPPPSDTPSTSMPPSVPISSLAYTSPSSSPYPISSSPSFPSSPPSSMPTVSTLEQQEEHYQNHDIPHHDQHLQEQQEQQQQQQQHHQQQQQQQPQQDHGQQQHHQLKQQQQHIISLYHSPSTPVDRRIYYPPSRESRRTFRAEDGRCYFLPKCIHFRPVSSKHAKASLHLQVSAGVYLCNGERCSEKGGNVDFRATPIITKKQVLVFRAFRNLLGWRPIGELPVVLHELLASEVFRLWEKTRRVLDEHAPPISDDEVIRISPPLNKVGGGNALAATAPAPATAPTPTTPVLAPFSEPATPAPSHSPSTVSGTPAPPAPAVAAPTPSDAAVPAGAAAVDPAPAPASTSADPSSVELVMRAGELRRVSRDKRRRCNEIYERLLADETVLSGTLEESPTGELPTAADKKAAEKALAAAAAASHRRILPAHRLNEAVGLTAAGVSAPMDVVIGGIQGARGGVEMGCGFGQSSYDMKLKGGCAASHHGPDIQRNMNGPVIGAVAQFGSPSPPHHARNDNGTFLGGGGGSAATYRPLLDGRAIFTCAGDRAGSDSGTADLGLGRPSARDVDDGSVHQHQRRNSYASRSSPHGGVTENGGGANGLRYSSIVTPGGSLGSPAAKRQRVDAVDRKSTDDTASTKFGGGADGANNNGHAVAGGGSARREADTGISPAGGSEDPASAARRQIWFREVQLNDARLQELRERAEREHARRRSELMSWMVDEEGGKHSGLGPNAGPEPASWDYGA